MLDDEHVDDRADADVDRYDDDEEAFADAEAELAADEPADAGAGNGQLGSPRDNLGHLVEFLATNLVDDPQGVEVVAEQRGQTVSITLRVPEEELGKVIGRQGRIARAIRTVLTIAGSRQNVRASLDIEG